MLDWIKKKITDKVKDHLLGLLQESSTRKALISMIVGMLGYHLTGGQLDAAAEWVGCSYVLFSAFTRDKTAAPTPAPSIPQPQSASAPITEPAPTSEKQEEWDGKPPSGSFVP